MQNTTVNPISDAENYKCGNALRSLQQQARSVPLQWHQHCLLQRAEVLKTRRMKDFWMNFLLCFFLTSLSWEEKKMRTLHSSFMQVWKKILDFQPRVILFSYPISRSSEQENFISHTWMGIIFVPMLLLYPKVQENVDSSITTKSIMVILAYTFC